MMAKKKGTKPAKVTRAPKIDRWEAENAADTLMRATEITANKPLLRKANAVLIKKQKAVKKALKK